MAARWRAFDRWLDRERLRTLARVFLLLQVGGFAFFVAGTHGAFAPQPVPPTTTDFASFYAAGLLANRGRAADIYQPAKLLEAGRQAIAPGVVFNPFLNPPVFLLICAPLARLPYLPAFILFEGATAIVWLAIATRIAGGGRLAAMTLACIPSVWWALGWGQNSFLTASLMGAGTLLLRRNPWLSGLAFGALCIKPHFGLLLPLALLAGRQWRTLIAAGLCVIGLSLITALCFGTATWQAFAAMALHARGIVESGRIAFAGHVDLAGAARLLGASAATGWILQACLSALSAVCVVLLWYQPPGARGPGAPDHDLRCAGLIAATVAALPFILFYDLVMVGVAAAWLVRAARTRGWRPGDRAWLAILMLADLLAYPAAALVRLAVGGAVAPILLWRVMRARRPIAITLARSGAGAASDGAIKP